MLAKLTPLRSKSVQSPTFCCCLKKKKRYVIYMSVERNISWGRRGKRGVVSGGQKQKTPSAEPDYPWKRDIVLAIFPADSEVRNVWHECLNWVKLALGWSTRSWGGAHGTLCPSDAMLLTGSVKALPTEINEHSFVCVCVHHMLPVDQEHMSVCVYWAVDGCFSDLFQDMGACVLWECDALTSEVEPLRLSHIHKWWNFHLCYKF